jgi:hypothetical protein
MKFKNKLGLLLTILAILTAGVVETNAQRPAAVLDGPRIKVTPPFKNLGPVPKGLIRKFNFQVSNIGNQDLIIKDVTGSCGCTDVTISVKTIKPRGRAIVNVTYKAGEVLGPVSESVLIQSNDPTAPVATFKFTATVTGG